jgi:Ca-activated chloride channel family protein
MSRATTAVFVFGILGVVIASPQSVTVTSSAVAISGRPAAGTSEARPMFRSTAREVNQIFTVQDHSGHPIPDLRRDDFAIQDSGKEVTEVAVFRQQTETPLHIAVAIDLSGSVSSRVKYEAEVSTKFLQRVLRPGDQGSIIGFNYRTYVIEDLPHARDNILAIHHREPKAATAFYDTVAVASARLTAAGGDTNHRDVLIVITDGVDNASRTKFHDALHAALRSGVIVLVLYTGSATSTTELRKLADMTGGQFFYTFTVGGVLKGLEKAEQAIRGQYLLAYRPADFQADGRFRQIDIRPLRKGLKVRCRKGYFAVEQPLAPSQTLR